MRLLILGAGGFIGSNLVEYLLAHTDHEVVGIDRSAEKLEGVAGDAFRFIEADVTDAAELLDREVAAADVVVDLVAYAHPSLYVEAPLDVIRLNFLVNLETVDRCVAHGTRLFQFSTSEVYGKPSGDRYVEDESDLVVGPVTRQRWVYSVSKQLLERVIHAHGLAGDLEYTIVRPFNFVGPRFDYLVPAGTKGGPRAFAHFMSALLTGGPIHLVDGGHQRRSFTHIDDASAAVALLLEHPGARNEIFNIGNPANDASIREVVALMMELYEELTGVRPRNELVEISGEEFYGPGYEDTTRVLPDISKLRALGWEPRRDLRTTFRETMRSYLDTPEEDR
ncbi:MAG TPA: bifunctional UDP-4-keto-pentose/UDP-xylose synthase [Actinobacteria bacterium]|nr:bifunctional UDP-4-keto-pentose/UDP-xylose synthase [Actinomycetota bacterium]